MTESLTGQNEIETQLEFVKRQQQEALTAIDSAEQEMAEMLQREFDSRHKIIEAVATFISKDSLSPVVEKMIAVLTAEIDRLKAIITPAPGQ